MLSNYRTTHGKVVENITTASTLQQQRLRFRHEMGFIREAANRVLFLADGILLEEGTPEEIFFDATHLIGDNVKGKLFMALADMSGEAIAEINQRDTDSTLEDLYSLMELIRVKLPADPFNVDYILIFNLKLFLNLF